MPPRPAHFPDAFVGFPPMVVEKGQQCALDCPGVWLHGLPGAARQMQGVHNLPIDVELALLGRSVTDAHRRGLQIARQPGDFGLREPTLTGHAVHDLHIGRTACDGAHQPVLPCQRFLSVPGQKQGIQREGRVAQPAVTVVAVAHAARVFGQRGCRGRDDATGWPVDAAPSASAENAAPARASALRSGSAPTIPRQLRSVCSNVLSASIGRLRRLVGWPVVEDEWHAFADADLEVGLRGHILAGVRTGEWSSRVSGPAVGEAAFRLGFGLPRERRLHSRSGRRVP